MAIQLTLRGLDLPVPPAALGTARDLWSYPDVPGTTISDNACLIGAAGEALCDSLLLRHGLLPMAVPGSLPTDRLVYVPGGLARVQIKTCSAPRDGAFNFNAAKGYRNSPQGARGYADDDYDILALVCLSENVIAFTSEVRAYHRVPVFAVPGLRADPRATLTEALIRIGLDPDAASAPAMQTAPAA